MKQEEPYRNQAERLRQKIEKVKEGVDYLEGNLEGNSQGNRMPSRSDIHRNKKNKTKLKMKFPIIRLLALFFILLPIVIFSAYSDIGTKELITSKNVISVTNGGIEEIKLEDQKEETNQDTPSPNIEENSMEEDIGGDKSNEPSEEQKVEDQPANDIEEETNIPSSDKEQTTTTNVEDESDQNVVYHTVQTKETLFRIAMKYYKSQAGIEIIQEANQLQGTEIKVGQVLKIPK